MSKKRNNDPIRDILTFAQDATMPPLEWMIQQHSRNGEVDPVTAAWLGSLEPAHMIDCVEELRPRELTRGVIAVLDLGHGGLMDALRRGDSGSIWVKRSFAEYRNALDQVSGARGDVHRSYWAAEHVGRAIAQLFEGARDSTMAREMVANALRATLAPLTMADLAARVERGHP